MAPSRLEGIDFFLVSLFLSSGPDFVHVPVAAQYYFFFPIDLSRFTLWLSRLPAASFTCPISLCSDVYSLSFTWSSPGFVISEVPPNCYVSFEIRALEFSFLRYLPSLGPLDQDFAHSWVSWRDPR